MTLKLGRLAVAALLAASLQPALPAAAQMPDMSAMMPQRTIRFGFGGGVTVPTSHAADALKQGINGQAFLLVNAGGIPLRFNLGYQKFNFKDAFLAGATGESTMLSGVAGLSVNLLKLGPLTPYVTAGLGAFSLKDDISSGEFANSSSEMRFGIDGGGGIRLGLGRLEGFIEGRIQNVYTEAGAIDTKTIKAIPVTFGLIF